MMNLNNFRVKSSRRDPEYSVYEINSKIVRRVPGAGVNIIEQNELDAFPSINKYELDGEGELFEVERLPFIVYPYELPFSLFKDSSLFYINLLESLLVKSLSLKDATPFNIAYLGKKQFKHFDLGSVESYQPNKGWTGYRQFLAEFYFPLLYLSKAKNIYVSDLIKLFFDRQWIFKHKFNWRNYLNLGFSIHYVFYKKSAIKKLSDKRQDKQKNINVQWVKNNLNLLKNHISSFNLPKEKTKWDDYYSQTILKEGYVDKKVALIGELLQLVKTEVTYATDWGANDGKFSQLILSHFKAATVISIESDYNAVDQLYQKCKTENVIPVYADVLNLSPNLGFDGERHSLQNRLYKVCDFQICLGLIHHLVHQENLSFDDIISFLSEASKEKSYLLIEFISSEDARHKLVQNPNYPYSLTREHFVESLKKHYEIIDTRQVIETRELFLCVKHT